MLGYSLLMICVVDLLEQYHLQRLKERSSRNRKEDLTQWRGESVQQAYECSRKEALFCFIFVVHIECSNKNTLWWYNGTFMDKNKYMYFDQIICSLYNIHLWEHLPLDYIWVKVVSFKMESYSQMNLVPYAEDRPA